MAKQLNIGGLFLGALLCTGLFAPALGQSVDLASARIIDLSHSFDANTIYWPTSPSGFELKQLHKGLTKGGFFYFSNTFCSPEHGGTHLDAPMHFAEERWNEFDIPPERFVGPGVVIDITEKVASNPDYTLMPADLTEWYKAELKKADAKVEMAVGMPRKTFNAVVNCLHPDKPAPTVAERAEACGLLTQWKNDSDKARKVAR